MNNKQTKQNQQLTDFVGLPGKRKKQIEIYQARLAETTEPKCRELLEDCIKQLRED